MLDWITDMFIMGFFVVGSLFFLLLIVCAVLYIGED